ncbi:type II toxin-antitoxin system death-on-curing family toxin [Gemmata sp. JC673]|uniref:Type II toxin-antitoxin system death-on-curing family toxin n=1 Tax=Gemmata algarum TaxID=2975278 RepID=A0ABU5EWP3_9BACT|nr:type II toxin-antitoxin system death-on-curing family toxin [Gemmata algarum]MDY3559358.1 type II toxin-antitoxin system death-on-curing family toxin [Gemmata algarum]
MTFLTVEQILEIHAEVIRLHGGDPAVHDHGLIESAAYQPQATFDGRYLNPTLPDMASALGFSLTSNHGFKDGNKRIGFTAMDVFLRLNGYKVEADVDDAERAALAVAAHQMNRNDFTEWVRAHIVPLTTE